MAITRIVYKSRLLNKLYAVTQQYPEGIALIEQEKKVSYLSLFNQAEKFSKKLIKFGSSQGVRVLLIVHPTIDAVVAVLGVHLSGATLVTLNPQMTNAEIKPIIEDSDPLIIVSFLEDERTEQLRSIFPSVIWFNQLQPDSGLSSPSTVAKSASNYSSENVPAFILYTTGSSGKPKGVMLSSDNVYASAQMLQKSFNVNAEDATILYLPISHCYGLIAILFVFLIAGATQHLMKGFSITQIRELPQDVKLTHIFGVPFAFYCFLEHAEVFRQRIQKVKYCISAGAPLSHDIFERWHETFNQYINQAYGLTESAPAATYNDIPSVKPQSVGRAVEGVGVRVRKFSKKLGETGEIELRGANVMMGYWNDVESSENAIVGGWLRTGDLGDIDDDGYVYLRGRKKELIIVGGENVMPNEIENVLMELPEVREAVVFGVDDERLGEAVIAVIECLPDMAIKTELIEKYCSVRLAKYKVPKQIIVTDSLPRHRNGKVQRDKVAQQYHSQVV